MDQAFPEPSSAVSSIEPRALARRIEGADNVFLLDTRAPSEFERWHIDGVHVDIVNIPYFEFLTGKIDEGILESLPRDREITVLCAKGEASRYVASQLDDLGYETTHLDRGMIGWASIYEAGELWSGGNSTVLQFLRPSSGCLAYLIVNGSDAAVIDPLRAFVGEYVSAARKVGANIEYVLDTHVHADHISGVRTVAAQTGATPVIPAAAAKRGLQDIGDYTTVEDGDELSLGETSMTALHAPGHTTGMTTYTLDDLLFTGDGLFVEGVARPDLERGDAGAPDAARQLHETLQTLVLSHPDDTLVAPGHLSDTTRREAGSVSARLGELRESLSALALDREEFVEFVLDDMPPRPANYEEIIDINLGREAADDETAFRLELGPNNCAAKRSRATDD